MRVKIMINILFYILLCFNVVTAQEPNNTSKTDASKTDASKTTSTKNQYVNGVAVGSLINFIPVRIWTDSFNLGYSVADYFCVKKYITCRENW